MKHLKFQQIRLFLPAFLFILSCFSLPAHAADNVLAATINRANEIELWSYDQWLNLLHYKTGFSGYTSQVDDERFFYAPDGKTNPQTELIETLKQLFSTTGLNDKHALCRFTARSQWLIEKLHINKESLSKPDCSLYKEWREMVQADSVTMIFPAYHLNSPSSMFGHTLLRLDSSDKSKTEWLSYAVNFGADIDESDNSILYAFRGLAGGYPGLFIIEPYFKKIQEYNRIEHRDIWEYRLNLTAEETERMISHLWELKTINFDYYFFDENCSYRLLELLEVARPGLQLTDEYVVTAIPVDTVRTIQRADLIESINFRPALATELQYAIDALTEELKDHLRNLLKNINHLESVDFKSLSPENQKTLIHTAYKYLRYQNTRKARDQEKADISHKLLSYINKYPTDIDITPDIPIPHAPEKGHNSKRLTIGYGEQEDIKFSEIGFKMSFHNLTDNPSGYLQGAQINIGSMRVRYNNDEKLFLQQLDLVDIFSLTPKSEFFDPLSWKIYSGFERQLTNGDNQLVYHVTGGAGANWLAVKNHHVFALAILRLEYNSQMDSNIEPAIGINTGLLSHFSSSTLHLEFSGEQFNDDIYRARVDLQYNIFLSTNHSIRLHARHQKQNDIPAYDEISLNYQYYF